MPSHNQIISQHFSNFHVSGHFHELNRGWPFTKGTTENISRYFKILCDKLKRAIQSTCRRIFSKWVDNACPNPGIESVGITGNVHTLTWWNTFCTALTTPIWTATSLDHSQMTENATNLPVSQEVKVLVQPYFYMVAWLPIKKKYLRALRNLFIIGRNVLKSSETICKNDVLTHFVLAASLLSNCWFFLTHKHILLILVSLTERWSWVHSILPSNSGYNSRLLWCLSGIPGNCHDGFCPHPILFDIQYSPHCETKWSLSYWISLNKL